MKLNYNNITQKNSFLTEIAKDFIPDIEGVWFGNLPDKETGRISKAHTLIIDNKKLHCVPRIMFVFFHEIAHVVTGHFDRKKEDVIEAEADAWALRELALIDEYGRPNIDSITHFICITNQSPMCLKEYFFCTRARCLLKPSVCIERQNNINRNIIEIPSNTEVCESCSRIRESCKLNLPVCLKSPKSIKKIPRRRESFIICKNCPQGQINMQAEMKNYMK